MSPKKQRTILSALAQARTLITEDRQVHWVSNLRADGTMSRDDLRLSQTYDRALKAIDKAVAVIDPALAADRLGAPCVGFLPKNLSGGDK